MKTILFDLDGVLINSSGLHKEAFLKASESLGIKINERTHDQYLEGLPTRKKIEWVKAHLFNEMSDELVEEYFHLKQMYSEKTFSDFVTFDQEKRQIIQSLKRQGLSVGICSNTIKATMNLAVSIMKLEAIDIIISAEDVQNPKPHPEIYTHAMLSLRSTPVETLIFEDSLVGLEAARASGAKVIEVNSPQAVTLDFVWTNIRRHSRAAA